MFFVLYTPYFFHFRQKIALDKTIERIAYFEQLLPHYDSIDAVLILEFFIYRVFIFLILDFPDIKTFINSYIGLYWEILTPAYAQDLASSVFYTRLQLIFPSTALKNSK